MIEIDLGTKEYYDSSINEFVYDKGGVVQFEYSLKTLYDWEGKWKKPFLKGELTDEEITDFYIHMALQPIDPKFITPDVKQQLNDYIADENTATVFTTHGPGGKGRAPKSKIHTAEELYALMFAASVPLEFEHRNLSRLMTVLRIISTHSEPPKKMSKQDVLRQNAELNRQRRAQMKTKG